MFLHLGADTMLPLCNLISIHDIKEKRAKITKEFLKKAQERDHFIYASNEKSKSFIVADGAIYFSPISANTLKKRAEHGNEFHEISSIGE